MTAAEPAPRRDGAPVAATSVRLTHAGWLVTPLRRLLHDPRRILAGLIAPGDTAVDFGCGPGFFTLPMAEMVGPDGLVVAVDLQAAMLETAAAARRACRSRRRVSGCSSAVPTPSASCRAADFALAFFMVHEVPDVERFLGELAGALRVGGRFLLVEPRGHVSAADFTATVALAVASGLRPLATPRVRGARTTLFERW